MTTSRPIAAHDLKPGDVIRLPGQRRPFTVFDVRPAQGSLVVYPMTAAGTVVDRLTYLGLPRDGRPVRLVQS